MGAQAGQQNTLGEANTFLGAYAGSGHISGDMNTFVGTWSGWANETGERIPLTMAETDPEKGTLTIIYQVVGKSTALFKTLQVGDGYQDVIGPGRLIQ